MGREVRRVPVDFEHPQDAHGRFLGVHDKTFVEAAAEWDREASEWPTNPRSAEYAYVDWAGERPTPDGYLPDTFDRDKATGWCLYENVSEGTPLTPVFATSDELADHLATKGTSNGERPTRAQARAMVEIGYAPSFAIGGGRMHNSYELAEDAAARRKAEDG